MYYNVNPICGKTVKLFLEDKLKFNEIPKVIKKVLSKHTPQKGNISYYLKIEEWSKQMVRSLVC